MAERLVGAETEYALVLRDRRGQRVNPSLAAEHLLSTAKAQWVHLPDLNSTGMFLRSGGRFYIDCGNHPELTTPECANPWDVVRYIKAGEHLLVGLGQALVQRQGAISEVCFFRQNVDYSGTGSTWGSHESYLHKAETALFRQHLLPHLVSRLIYTGSGGFDSLYPGIRFILSPRVPHLQADVSGDSTHARGILHTKDESLSARGYHRLHLLCSESLFSEFAMFLRYGATALVVALIEAGLQPGGAVQLLQPLPAMQIFAQDPHCRKAVPDAQGRPLTALAIQRHYLALAEAHRQAPFMPPWAEEVCRQWRRVLDLLEAGGSDAAATSLDWAIRYSVFTQFIHRHGYTWESVGRCNALAETAAGLPEADDWAEEIQAVAAGEADALALEQILAGRSLPLKQSKLGSRAFQGFLALRAQLFELDTRFGQLAEAGLFQQLDRAGVLHHHFPGVDNFEHAMEFPPAIGRARLRGNCVRRLGTKGGSPLAVCDWTAVWEQQHQRVLDLADPYAGVEDWKALPAQSAAAPDSSMPRLQGSVHEIMQQLRSLNSRIRSPRP